MRVTDRKIRKTIIEPEYTKKSLIRAVLYYWVTIDWMETGFSLNNRPKRAENTHGRHYAPITVSHGSNLD